MTVKRGLPRARRSGPSRLARGSVSGTLRVPILHRRNSTQRSPRRGRRWLALTRGELALQLSWVGSRCVGRAHVTAPRTSLGVARFDEFLEPFEVALSASLHD